LSFCEAEDVELLMRMLLFLGAAFLVLFAIWLVVFHFLWTGG